MRLIVFDFDGTLVDTMEAYAEKASELIEKFYGVPREKARKMYLETSGTLRPYQERGHEGVCLSPLPVLRVALFSHTEG